METSTGVKRIVLDTEKLIVWDSSLLAFLTRIFKRCGQRNVQVETEGLPQGVQSLISLSSAAPKKEDARKTVSREAFFARVGSDFLEFVKSAGEPSAFRIKLDAYLEEIPAASRSVQALTEYLERHPEALLQGKSGS